MSANKLFAEEVIVKADVPVDMNTAAFVGSRCAMNKGCKLAIVLNMGDSVGAVVDFTLKQHTAAVGGSSKVLAISNPYFKKAGADTSFTKVEVSETAPASNYVLSADFAAQEGIVIFEVLESDLDINNGYAYISIEAADSTAAKLLSASYLVCEAYVKPAYSQSI